MAKWAQVQAIEEIEPGFGTTLFMRSFTAKDSLVTDLRMAVVIT
jgi:hypothetical protein